MCGMRLGRRLPTVLALALAAPGVSHCSNVTGNNPDAGTMGPGCPTTEADAAADAPAGEGGDDDDDDGGGSPCKPPDSDGVLGGCYVFDLTVDDTGFTPRILKAQNVGQVTVTLTNAGSRPHDFAVGCTTIAFAGCPATYCFPDTAHIASVAPGASATTTFVLPYVEGIYDFVSDLPGDSQIASDGGASGIWGQFVVQ